MKIALVNPHDTEATNLGAMGKFVKPIPPLNLTLLAATLEKSEFKISVVDQHAEDLSEEHLVKFLGENRFDLIGFSCLTPTIGIVSRVTRRLRNELPDAKIVLGNTHAVIYCDDLLQEGIGDFVIKGEGEEPLLSLACSLRDGTDPLLVSSLAFLRDGQVVHTADQLPSKSLDDLPFPAWDLIKLHLYKGAPLISMKGITVPIQSMRGCPYKCTFCAQDSIFPVVRTRSMPRVAEEIEYVIRRYGVRQFGFIDPFFPRNPESGMEFADEIQRRDLHRKIVWTTETRVDKVNLKLLKRLKSVGCRLIQFGFEVGNKDVLQRLRKGTTIEQGRNASRWAKEAGIRTLGLFILGAPSETIATCRETIRLAKQLDTDIAKFNIVVPLPGSHLYTDVFGESGQCIAPKKYSSWYVPRSEEDDLLYHPDEVSSKSLIRLRKEAMLSYYIRPRFIMRSFIRRTISIRNMFSGAAALLQDTIFSR